MSKALIKLLPCSVTQNTMLNFTYQLLRCIIASFWTLVTGQSHVPSTCHFISLKLYPCHQDPGVLNPCTAKVGLSPSKKVGFICFSKKALDE